MLRNWFGSKPEATLSKAERALAAGEPVRALELAERAARRGGPSQAEARELASRARAAVIEQALSHASEAEAGGDLEDAADWIEAALVRLRGDESRRGELEGRLRDLRRRSEEAAASDHFERFLPGEDDPEISEDDLFEGLLGGLAPHWAERFSGRDEGFRRAWIALNEGLCEEAISYFEAIVADDEEDLVARLERGRCHLLLGRPEEARQDFESVWPRLGDEALDLAGHLSVPGLWAEASLELGEADAVAARLEELVREESQHGELPLLYGRALLEGERYGEAREFLGREVGRRAGEAEFSFLLARALVAGGEPEDAVEVLERAVAPSCASGRCGTPSRHLPSLKLLARLHLAHGRGAERARELMAWVLRDQGGRLTADDEELLAYLREE